MHRKDERNKKWNWWAIITVQKENKYDWLSTKRKINENCIILRKDKVVIIIEIEHTCRC